jgi:hypothetical protein
VYTGVFSPPYSAPVPEATAKESFTDAAKEAAIFGTPWVDDEFGANASAVWDGWITQQIGLQNAFTVGSGFWLWKQRKGPWYRWAVVNDNGSLRSSTKRAQIISMPHVDTVPGRLLATSAGTDALSATVSGPGGTATLWGGTVVLHGGATMARASLSSATIDGHRAASRCRRVHYESQDVDLTGCLVTVHVPAGQEVIDLRAG